MSVDSKNFAELVRFGPNSIVKSAVRVACPDSMLNPHFDAD
jgi:hypothetical protein